MASSSAPEHSFMTLNRQRTSALILISLLAVLAVAGIRFTSGTDQTVNISRRRSRTQQEQQARVSQRSFDTAFELSKLVNTRDEDRLSRDAMQLADHDLDLAFTTALREAQLYPSAPTPQSQAIRDRMHDLDAQIKDDQTQVTKLSAAINAARADKVEDLQRQLDLTEAELSLHREELEDAKQDLARTGDDVESRIQRLMDLHKASQHKDDSAQQPPWNRYAPFEVPGNMMEQVRMWRTLREKRLKIVAAQASAVQSAADIDRRHDELEKELSAQSPSLDGQQKVGDRAHIAALERLSQARKMVTDYDRRMQDEQQLAQVYGNWATLLSARQTACVHGVLIGVLWVLFILACLVFADYGIDRFFATAKGDRRRSRTARTIARFGLRFVCLIWILFVGLGKPSQLTTIIGLAGAGLTVALKDFIVGFFGWFVLMGKNGIRAGDWVEINGISGEVVEIGLLRTVLLETGNWTDSGHPTGRRVTFVNSFAIEGHYFNFSTGGQWLWDSLEIAVPAGKDPFPITDSILKAVVTETEANAKLAESEWQHVTHKYGLENFSAAPSINVRPNGQGVDIVVRYITSANERYEVRSKLYRTVVELLHGRHAAAAAQS
jgi:small-conductance mechanosensitive channel